MPGALSIATICEAFSVIFEQKDRLTAWVSLNPRLRVSDVAATGQAHAQELAVASEGHTATRNCAVGVANCADCRRHQPFPEPACLWVLCAPEVAKFLDLVIGQIVG